MVTGDDPMEEGRHYWEVELTVPGPYCSIMIGAVPPGLCLEEHHALSNDAYFLSCHSGGLFGYNGMRHAHSENTGRFAQGDRIGVLLDMDEGSLRFYRNGVRYGPGFTCGVTGPLVRAVQLVYHGQIVTALPGAEPPADPSGRWARSSRSALKEACNARGIPARGNKPQMIARLSCAPCMHEWQSSSCPGLDEKPHFNSDITAWRMHRKHARKCSCMNH
jgi:hypothetical protein